MPLNSALLKLASMKVWQQAGQEKRGFQPGAPMDPAMAGGAPPPGGAPPMGGDPSMGGAPMDPSMAGGAPPLDPMAAGMAPGAVPPGAMAPPMPMDPNAAAGGGMKMKPEQMMQMLDFRLYNMQQQITALLNKAGVEIPAGALVTPPGSPTPIAEAAVPGGPQDPAQQASADAGGGSSAINAIDPIQGASPELAGGGGGMGGEKIGSYEPAAVRFLQDAQANAPAGYMVQLVKHADATVLSPGCVDDDPPPKKSSPPNQALNMPGMGKTPSLTGPPTAGGSVDPKSRTEAGDDLGPANASEKTAAQEWIDEIMLEPDHAASYIGEPFATGSSPVTNASAVASLLRSRTAVGAA